MPSRFVPSPGPPRLLALAQLVNSVGDGAYYVCSALYFTRIIGLSATELGVALTVGWAIGFAAGVPLGHLADRKGPRGVAVLLAVATSAVVASYLLVGNFPTFLLAAAAYASCQCGLTAARQALLAGLVEPARRTETRAFTQAAANAGLAVGAALGGIALHFDTRTSYTVVFLLDAVAFLAAALVLRRLPAVAPVPPGARGAPKLAVLRDRPYALVSFLNMVLMLHIPLIGFAIPLWIVTWTAAPSWMVAALLLLNTTSVVLFQVKIAMRVTDLASAARQVRRSGVVLMGSCVAFALSAFGSEPWTAGTVLLVAAMIQAAGEMMQASGGWQLSFDLAPADQQGQYQGFFGGGLAVARMVGPAVLTPLIIGWGQPGWLVLGAVFVLAGAAMVPAVRWAERSARSYPPSAQATMPS